MPNENEQKPKEQKAKDQKPKEQKPQKPKQEKAKEPVPQTEEKGVLESAAVAIGSTLGSIAVKTGIVQPQTQSKKIGKLPKKNKKRLPRKEKKRARKAHATKKA